MARIFEGGEFVAMKAVALASEEMHDDCSDRDVSQDGDVTGPNRMRRPKDKVVRLELESSYQKRLQRTQGKYANEIGKKHMRSRMPHIPHPSESYHDWSLLGVRAWFVGKPVTFPRQNQCWR